MHSMVFLIEKNSQIKITTLCPDLNMIKGFSLVNADLADRHQLGKHVQTSITGINYGGFIIG